MQIRKFHITTRIQQCRCSRILCETNEMISFFMRCPKIKLAFSAYFIISSTCIFFLLGGGGAGGERERELWYNNDHPSAFPAIKPSASLRCSKTVLVLAYPWLSPIYYYKSISVWIHFSYQRERICNNIILSIKDNNLLEHRRKRFSELQLG